MSGLGGGRSKRGRKRPAHRDAAAIDIDAPAFADVDWDQLPRHEVELDPALVERIRSRARLAQITLRVGPEQIAEAKRVAARTGTPYQAVMRRWLAEGASRARAESRSRPPTPKRRTAGGR